MRCEPRLGKYLWFVKKLPARRRRWWLLLLAAALLVTSTHLLTSHILAAGSGKVSSFVHTPSRRCNSCNTQQFGQVSPRVPAFCQQEIFLLTLVISHPNNSVGRMAIRSTWAQLTTYHNRTLKTVFVMARTDSRATDNAISRESRAYGDVVIIDMIEDYYKLTQKTLAALHWSLNQCKRFAFLLKTDDDSFNNLFQLTKFILEIGQPDRLLGGDCMQYKTNRQKHTKWYTSHEYYDHPYIPLFCRGPGYVLSRTTAAALLNASADVQLFRLEDVYLTGFVRQAINVSVTHIPRYFSLPSEVGLCTLPDAINVHHVTPTLMLQLWSGATRPMLPVALCDALTDLSQYVVAGCLLLTLLVCVVLYRNMKHAGVR